MRTNLNAFLNPTQNTMAVFLQDYLHGILKMNTENYFLGLRQDEEASGEQGWKWADGTTPGPDDPNIKSALRAY